MSKVEQEIEQAMKEWKQEIYDRVDNKVRSFAMAIISQAIIERQTAPGKHNFTGNLLNSIVVCVYKDGQPDMAFYPSQYGVTKAIRFKMTNHRHYHFKKDYDGEESDYDPQIATNQGWGEDDARNFFREYNPGNGAKYYIVVAYPTEYASFVEAFRHTTGFTGTYTWTKHNGWKILQLPWTDSAPEQSSNFAPF